MVVAAVAQWLLAVEIVTQYLVAVLVRRKMDLAEVAVDGKAA